MSPDDEKIVNDIKEHDSRKARDNLQALQEIMSRSKPKGRSIVAYPLKISGGSKWDNNELRFSLRSLEMHWKGSFDEVVILSESLPSWINKNSISFTLSPSYVDCLKKAIKRAGPGGNILWMNDDILFCKDTTWSDLVNPVRSNGSMNLEQAKKWSVNKNGWIKRCGQIMLDLHARNMTTHKFSTHTPYWYEADKLEEVLKLYQHLGYKVAIESAYGNFFLEELGGVKPFKDKFTFTSNSKKIPFAKQEDYRFINIAGNALGAWGKGFLRGRYPYKSKYEL